MSVLVYLHMLETTNFLEEYMELGITLIEFSILVKLDDWTILRNKVANYRKIQKRFGSVAMGISLRKLLQIFNILY